MLEKIFHLSERRTNVGREFRGAIATFLTMSYILFANPAILHDGGVPFESAAACTALAAGLSSILMGLVANFPVALASGMGVNSIVAYQVVHASGTWQTAMGLVVLDGLVVFLLVLAGVRETVMQAIPRDLKLSIGAGIGLFIAFIGLVNAKIIVVPADTIAILAKNPHAALPPVTYGSFSSPEVWVASAGFCLTALLMTLRFQGAVVVGILFSTGVAFLLGLSHAPAAFHAPSFANLFQADIRGAFRWPLVPLLLSLVLIDFFDTVGTVTAIAEQGKLMNEKGMIPRLRAILAIDGVAASIGGLCGASSVTSYIESAAGVAEGARTGLHTVFVGILFLGAIFLAPIAGMVPAAATAPALILVGFLMSTHLKEIDFEDFGTAIPAFITFLTIPLTFSISHGIGLGFISYVILQCLTGRYKRVHPFLYGVAALFLAYFVWGAG